MTSPILLIHLEQIKLVNFFDTPTLGKRAYLVDIDVFFSLHDPKSNDLLYISEVVSTASRISFGAVTVPASDRQYIRLKVWLRRNDAIDGNRRWALAQDMVVDLRRLRPLKGSLDEINDDLFSERTPLWTFDSQDYVLPEQAQSLVYSSGKQKQHSISQARAPKLSYTVDEIRRLTNLYEGICELDTTKERLSGLIDAARKGLLNQSDFNPEAIKAIKYSLHKLHQYISKQKNKNDTVLSKIYQAKILINSISTALEEDSQSQQSVLKERLEFASSRIHPIYESLESSLYPLMLDTFRRLSTVIGEVFPIELLESSGLMSIVGVELPNTTKELAEYCISTSHNTVTRSVTRFDTPSEIDRINGGLSFIVHLMMCLMHLLDVPVVYPMEFKGGICVIRDHLLAPAKKVAVYPLSYKEEHTEKFIHYGVSGKEIMFRNTRFEQGLHLLNRNLVTLISATADLYTQLHGDTNFNHQLTNNIPLECVDNLLWNLKYLLLFLTAVESES